MLPGHLQGRDRFKDGSPKSAVRFVHVSRHPCLSVACLCTKRREVKHQVWGSTFIFFLERKPVLFASGNLLFALESFILALLLLCDDTSLHHLYHFILQQSRLIGDECLSVVATDYFLVPLLFAIPRPIWYVLILLQV